MPTPAQSREDALEVLLLRLGQRELAILAAQQQLAAEMKKAFQEGDELQGLAKERALQLLKTEFQGLATQIAVVERTLYGLRSGKGRDKLDKLF